MIIAVSGKSGCGNTTTSGLLAKQLGYRLVNYTFHTMAEEQGIDFGELLERAKADYQVDRDLDRRQIELSQAGDCVVASRLAAWLLREKAFTVYLEASREVRAARIHMREGGDLIALTAFTAMRDDSDRRRYMEIYGIDIDDYGFVDLVINVDHKVPGQIVEEIRAAILIREGAGGSRA